MEAYHEYLHRQADQAWDEQRAYDIILRVTGDVDQAERAANQVKFARTPIE